MGQQNVSQSGQILIPTNVGRTLLAQSADAPVPADPLIAQGSEDAIYIGVAVLAAIVIATIGMINGRVKAALLFALFFGGILIALILAL
jgi:hypothetical protein